jgi:signal transduction histidine kinase/HAMP domain-containing protein
MRHSVGTKLAAVIVLSLAIVGSLTYIGLTRREQANLLRAKQMAGEMVVDLFTDAVCAALVFDDQVGVSDGLKYLGKNQEVAYAAVWKLDPDAPDKLGDRVAEFRRAADGGEYVAPVPHAGRNVQESDNALTISAPVTDPSGVPVGHAVVVFSLERERQLYAELSRHILYTAFATAALIALLIIGSIRSLVVRRLSQLAAAAKKLETGASATIERGANDEVGQLAGALSKMAGAIVEREARIQNQNREMRLVLDHVVQGFITVGLDGVMSTERSAIVDRWFGSPPPGAMLSTYLSSYAPHYADWVEIGLEQLRDDVLPAELVLDQFPKRFSAAGREFEVTYTAITQGDKVQRLLVILSDITTQLGHEQLEREQKELVALFQRMSIDRSGVEEFLTEAANLVGAIRSEADPKVQQRLVHTLKGNCAIYGLDSYAEIAHRIESELAETGGGLNSEQRHILVQMWKGIVERVSSLLSGRRRDTIEIERKELDALIDRARSGMTAAALTAHLAEWTREPVELRFERLARQAIAIARRLGKPEPQVEIDGQGIRLEPAGWTPFWTAMVHIIRNAMDHGIEDSSTRSSLGKPEAGALKFLARRVHGRLVLSVVDDGKGIDWSRVRAKASAVGLPVETQADLVEALFSDGLTTRDDVSDVSGRGVGLAALRQVVDGFGGTIAIQTELGRGTTFEIALDERRVISTSGTRDSSKPNSLMPRFG